MLVTLKIAYFVEKVLMSTEIINATLSQFTKLGFVVHKNKSILVQTKEIVFLGNINNDGFTTTREKRNHSK